MKSTCIHTSAVVLFVFGMLTPGAHAGIYPSLTDYDSTAIVNQGAWSLFWAMDGFNNTPNATTYDAGRAVVQWLDSYSYSHEAMLVTSYDIDHNRIVTLTCAQRDEAGNEIYNKTTSMVNFAKYDGASYHLTAFRNETNVTHIFWERSLVSKDIPERYWLFHESVAKNGTVITSAELFYFEEKGPGGLVESPVLFYLILVGLSVFTVLGALAIVVWFRRKRRAK